MLNTNDIKNYTALSELEKKKLQQKFHEDDLSYLASHAIESNSISLADIEELHSRIDLKTKTGFTKTYLNTFVALVCGIFIGATVFFAWFENKRNHDAHYEAINTEKTLGKTIQPEAITEVTVVEKAKTGYHKEHFSINHSAEQIESELALPETIETKSVTGITTQINENIEINLRYLPNAPVIFIKDLKVANYNLYYFKNNQSIDLQTGLSAEFANKTEKENAILTKNPNENYYAHQIIKDGIINFSAKNYSGCIDLLGLLYKHNKRDVNAQFYIAMSYYYLGNYDKSKLFFDEVLDNDINIFEQESEFYKAMCLFNAGQKGEAASLLRSISERKCYFTPNAPISS